MTVMHNGFHQLLSSLKTLSPGQVQQLRQQLDCQFVQPKQPPANAAKRARPAAPREKPTTPDEFNRRLLAAGTRNGGDQKQGRSKNPNLVPVAGPFPSPA